MFGEDKNILNRNAALGDSAADGIRRKLMRAGVLVFALLIAALYAQVCFCPVVGTLGPIKYHFSNPFKLLAVTVLALQVWWLLTPRAGELLRRKSHLTWWQMKLSIEAVELCCVAVIGILATDLQSRAVFAVVLLRPAIAIEFALLAVAIVVLTTNQRWRLSWALLDRFRGLWRSWTWRARLVAIALLLHMALISKTILGYWEQTSGQFSAHEINQSTVLSYTGKILCNFDYFCRACNAKIPADARILYHGGNEGLILAFELYPRRVFMLPQEQRDMFHNCWRNELWCRGMAADPLDECWEWDPAAIDVPEEQFLKEHGITHVVMFDSLSASNCRIQAVR
jgi:hypothetical protein